MFLKKDRPDEAGLPETDGASADFPPDPEDFPAAESPVNAESPVVSGETEPVSPHFHFPKRRDPVSREPAAVPSGEPKRKKREKQPPDLSPMRVSSFMGALILLSIPVVNLIAAFRWTFRRHENRNRRNIGIAFLLLLLLLIAVLAVAVAVSQTFFKFDLLSHLLAPLKRGLPGIG